MFHTHWLKWPLPVVLLGVILIGPGESWEFHSQASNLFRVACLPWLHTTDMSMKGNLLETSGYWCMKMGHVQTNLGPCGLLANKLRIAEWKGRPRSLMTHLNFWINQRWSLPTAGLLVMHENPSVEFSVTYRQNHPTWCHHHICLEILQNLAAHSAANHACAVLLVLGALLWCDKSNTCIPVVHWHHAFVTFGSWNNLVRWGVNISLSIKVPDGY